MLANKLGIDATDPGAWVLNTGYSEIQRMLMQKSPEVPLKNGNEVYAKHFTVEYRDDKGLWQCPAGKRNDLWDCAQMGIGLARYLGFQNMVSEKEQSATKPAMQQPTGGSDRPSWFNQRGS